MKKNIVILLLLTIGLSACGESKEDEIYADEVDSYDFDGADNNREHFMIRDRENINQEDDVDEDLDENDKLKNPSEIDLPDQMMEEDTLSSAEILRLMEEGED